MSLWQQRKQLLSDHSFILFLIHAFITVAGGAMCYIILTWFAVSTHTNHAILATLLVSLSFWLPSTILGPFAGVVVDRYPRKQVIAISNLLRVLAFISIGTWLMYDNTLWLCCLLNVINGIIFTVLGPGIMAFIRELVANETLLAANSTIDICVELANVVGMGLAGVMISFTKVSYSLFIIAACIGIGILMLFFIKQRAEDMHHRQNELTKWHDFKEGLKYLKDRPTLTLLYFLNTTLFVQFMISPILLAPFIKTVLHGGGRDFSLTELVLSAGIIVGSFLIPWISIKYGRVRCLFWAIIWLSVIFLFIGMNHSVHTLVILYALLGIGLPLWSVIASYAQEFMDKTMQGRVQSLSVTMSSLCILIIYIILGLSSSSISLVHVYWFCSGLGAIALLLLYKIHAGIFSLEKVV